MTPILSMASDRKQVVRNRRDPLGSVESGVPAATSTSTPASRRRLEPGSGGPGTPATRWQGREVVLGCLAWYLAVLGLLVLLASFTARRPTEAIGPPDRPTPTDVAPPEGPSRHQ
jgi:hypothetical protein